MDVGGHRRGESVEGRATGGVLEPGQHPGTASRGEVARVLFSL
jgi:hypothetical protein